MAVKKVKRLQKKAIKKAVKAKKITATKKAAPKKATKKKVSKSVKKIAVVKKAAKTSKPTKARVVSKAIKKPVSKIRSVAVKIIPQKVTVAKKSVVKTMKVQSIQKKSQPMDRDVYEDMGMVDNTKPVTSKKATTLLGSLEFTPYQPKSDETYMNEHQKVHFRKILDAWKQQLMQDVDLTVGHLKEEAVFYADPVDRAAQEEGFNLELRTRDRERKVIKKIEQSLDLLNTGEYGYCEDCGAEIGIRRLEARPTAVKCIDCKTFQEIREKQLGG